MKLVCYDHSCQAEFEYYEADIIVYYDAQLGEIESVKCKCCGLTNQLN